MESTKTFYNALTFDSEILKKPNSAKFAKINYVGREKLADINTFVPIEYATEADKHIYVGDITDYDMTNKAIELSSNGARIMLSLCNTLGEVGECDKKYGAPPISLAHKLGLLDNALVCGANYLDRDDIDLLLQSNAAIILTPTTSMGNGYGIPPLRMLLSCGVTTHIGTGELQYNPNADLEFEAELLRFAVNGHLCTKDAITQNDIIKLLNHYDVR